MKAVQMDFNQVWTQLEAWGSENTRAIYARQGAGENQFGVMMGNLRGLAKKLKTDHPLALQLWATGNVDAMVLATMLLASSQLTQPEVEAMLQPLTYYRLVDEFDYNAVAKTAFAGALRQRWSASPLEMTGRAGWNLWIALVTSGQAEEIDFDALLRQIEAEVRSAPKRKQESMNRCLVEVGVHFPDLTPRCIAIGERLGRFDNTPVPKGCTSSYAPEWIAAVLKRKK